MTATMVLDNRVLVLNKNWQPVNVMSVLGAIHKVWKERARFVDPETYATYDFEGWVSNWEDAISQARIAEDRVVSGAGIALALPEVVVCTEYGGYQSRVGSHRPPKFSRTNIYRRDKNTCQYCGHKHKVSDLTMEHVVPKSQGGQMTWTNIALACFSCNQKKKDRTPEKAGMRLIRQPFRPTAQDVAITPSERLMRKIGKDAPQTWEAFLSKAYWSVELQD